MIKKSFLNIAVFFAYLIIRIRKTFLRCGVVAACLMLAVAAFAGCSAQPASAEAVPKPAATQTVQVSEPAAQANETAASGTPRHVFLFIGDGRPHVQVNAAQI